MKGRPKMKKRRKIFLLSFWVLIFLTQNVSARSYAIIINGMGGPNEKYMAMEAYNVYQAITKDNSLLAKSWYLTTGREEVIVPGSIPVGLEAIKNIANETKSLINNNDLVFIYFHAHSGGFEQDPDSPNFGVNSSRFPVVVSELDTVKNMGQPFRESELFWRDEVDTSWVGHKDLNGDGDLDDFIYIVETIRLGNELVEDYRVSEALSQIPGRKFLVETSCYAPLHDNFIGANKAVLSATTKLHAGNGMFLSMYFLGTFYRRNDGFLSGDINHDNAITIGELISYTSREMAGNWLRFRDEEVDADSLKGKTLASSLVERELFKVLGIEITKGQDVVLNNFSLSQNFPNPFNPSTTITYFVDVKSPVKLIVYDEAGREVADLVDQIQSAGEYAITFNGAQLPSGVYFYKLLAGEKTKIKKMTLIK
jgi:hypothetical protein